MQKPNKQTHKVLFGSGRCRGPWHKSAAAGNSPRLEAAAKVRSDDVPPEGEITIDVARDAVLTASRRYIQFVIRHNLVAAFGTAGDLLP